MLKNNTQCCYISLFLFLSVFFIGIKSSAQSPIKRFDQELQKDLEKVSSKLFLEANQLYDQGKYWEAARDLIILLDFHPYYSRIDEGIYILGDCLYEIGLKDGANKLYRHMVKKYLQSPYLPNALLGLQRIQYDRRDYDKCIEYYNVIKRANPPRKTFDISRYYAGLSYSKFKDYDKAIDIFSKMSDKSAYYPYGLYSMALSYLRKRDVRNALNTFKRIKGLAVTSKARRHIIDETHLTMGYIYYELGYYRNALKEFQAVSSDHENYSDALLAAGWSFVKLEDYQEAIEPLTSLVSIAPNSEQAEESLFLLGRSYMKLEMYDEALSVYENLINIFPRREVIPALVNQVTETLVRESIKIEDIKMELLMLESKLLDSLPLDDEEKYTGYLKNENKRIKDARVGLLKRIRDERRTFDELSLELENIRKRTDIKKERRDWRAYAEYGKARASFLKQVQ